MKKEIEIKLGKEKIPSQKFLDAVNSFLAILEGVVQNLKEEDESIKWNVEVRKGSARILVSPDEDLLSNGLYDRTEDAFFSGLENIKERKYPDYFNDTLIREYKKIAKVLYNSGSESIPVNIKSEKRVFEFKSEYAECADYLLKRNSIEDYGTIEGRLDTISQKKGLKIYVTDELENRSITCIIDEKIKGKAINGFGKRVAVSGLIRYSDFGTPVSIRVEDINIFPDSSELPSYNDVRGIFN